MRDKYTVPGTLKAALWDIDQDPLVIDLDGDGRFDFRPEMLAAKGAAEATPGRHRLRPSRREVAACNDNNGAWPERTFRLVAGRLAA